MQGCMDTDGFDTHLGRVSQTTNSQYKALSHILSCIEQINANVAKSSLLVLCLSCLVYTLTLSAVSQRTS
jgi:hypothetical protein